MSSVQASIHLCTWHVIRDKTQQHDCQDRRYFVKLSTPFEPAGGPPHRLENTSLGKNRADE